MVKKWQSLQANWLIYYAKEKAKYPRFYPFFYKNVIPMVLGFVCLVWMFSKYFSLVLNASSSLPERWFLLFLLDLSMNKGQYIAVKMIAGPHQGEDALKIVKGVAGDVVTEKNREFFINGESVGRAKEYSSSDVKLEMNAFRGKIPTGKIWVYAPHRDSFDSRYAWQGLIDASRVVGRVYAIY